MITDKMVEAAARSDANIDGRPFDRLGSADRERYLARSRAALEATEQAAWEPIDNPPSTPCMVELFSRDLTFTDQNGNEIPGLIEPYRDERRELGFWDGESFYHMGTAHGVFEFMGEPGWPRERYPTHWRPLPSSPKTEG